MAGGIGTKEIRTKYPHVSGLTAETTKQEGRKSSLVPTHGSLVPRKNKVGI